MLLAILLILLITLAVWGLSKAIAIKICPACVGVSGTWLLLMLGVLTGILDPNRWVGIIAILMGGSVAGIAFQGEKSIKWAQNNQVWWKLLVMLPGFLAVYGAVNYINWGTFAFAIVALGLVMYAFFLRKKSEPHVPHPTDSSGVQKIEKGLEECC